MAHLMLLLPRGLLLGLLVIARLLLCRCLLLELHALQTRTVGLALLGDLPTADLGMAFQAIERKAAAADLAYAQLRALISLVVLDILGVVRVS